jgi:hypothetical protein
VYRGLDATDVTFAGADGGRSRLAFRSASSGARRFRVASPSWATAAADLLRRTLRGVRLLDPRHGYAREGDMVGRDTPTPADASPASRRMTRGIEP